MAIHQIKLRISKGIEVLNTDIVFVVKNDGQRFGTLTVSRGSIDWRPNKKRIGGKNHIEKSWMQFDKLMRD